MSSLASGIWESSSSLLSATFFREARMVSRNDVSEVE